MNKKAALILALAIGLAVLLVAPARVETDISSMTRTCFEKNWPGDCTAHISQLEWGWAMNIIMQRDIFEARYLTNKLDMAAGIAVAAGAGVVVYFVLTERRRGRT